MLVQYYVNFNLFITYCAFPNPFYEHFIPLCHYGWLMPYTIRKQAYSNILKIVLPKNINFQIVNSDIFLIYSQNVDCGYTLELLDVALFASTNNLCFWAEIRKQCILL